MSHYYIGYTKAGALVKRESTRGNYTHATVENQYSHFRTGDLITVEHGPVVSLNRCHFSTSHQGAWKLMPKGHYGELVELTKVSAPEYRAAIKAAEAK